MGDTKSIQTSVNEFNLCRRFAFLSFVCIVFLTVILWIIVSRYLTSQILDREWETTAQFVRRETKQFVVPQDFEPPNFAAVADKFKKLHDQITTMPDIVRIKVYNARGVVVWSDEDRLVGATFTDNSELREALAGKTVADLSPVAKGENVYERGSFQNLVEVYVPVFSQDGKKLVGVIETYKSADALFRDIKRARMVVLAGAVGGGLLLYFSLFAIVHQATNRLSEQREYLLTMQSELVASHRMAAVGEMAAAVAHGIGNPLSSIRAAAQVAKLDYTEHDNYDQSVRTQSALENIIQQVDRVQKRMQGLLNFARPLEPCPVPVELNSLLKGVVDVLQPRFVEAEVGSQLELDPNLPKAQLDANQVEQVFMGLVTNALEATPRGGTVTIRTTVSCANGNSKSLNISIEDTGEGIPIENRQRVVEPFFTTKPHGTGIGLPLAKKFVERNGGQIAISNGPSGGAKVDVTFLLSGSN
jgi:two-component system, NtrC family, sensor histidine kinase HydH